MEPWADPGEPSPEEAKERDIIDKQIFNIEPQFSDFVWGLFSLDEEALNQVS